MPKHILTINGGSSSIKFGLFDDGQPPERLLAGKIDRIGLANAELSVSGSDKPRESRQVHAPTQTAATTELMNWLEQRAGLNALAAVGHRIVHGGPHYSAPELVRPEGAKKPLGIFGAATGIQAQRERITLQDKILAMKKMLRADPEEATA